MQNVDDNIFDDTEILNEDRIRMTNFPSASGSNMAPSGTGSFPYGLKEGLTHPVSPAAPNLRPGRLCLPIHLPTVFCFFHIKLPP